jgi:hypothetical protein
MDAVVFYVTRQRNGWSVERDRVVQSGHAHRDSAIACARKAAAAARAKGLSSSVRIQEEAGVWREERSFAPVG